MKKPLVRSAAAFGAALLLFAGACTEKVTDPIPPSTSAAGSWRRIPSAPGGARQEVAAALVGGKVYVVGGLLAGGLGTSLVEAFEPSTSTWSDVPPMPARVHHAMAAELNGKLVVMGGFGAELGGAASKRVFTLDGDRWSESASLRRPRAAGAAVTVGDKIIVVGGVAGSDHVGPAEIFDGTSWRDGASIPSGLDHIGAATDGTKVFVVGGRRGSSHFGTFQLYDPSADSWSRLKSMPTARSGLGAAFALGSVIAVGGEGPRIFPEVEAYGVAKGTWSRLPDMGVPRHGVGVVAIGKTLYAIVGGNKVGLAPSAVCEALTLT